MTPPTARQLNRATLERQLLLGRATLTAEHAVAHLLALQAQEPSTPYLALWARLRDFSPEQLDGALAEHRLVRSSLLRLTLHLVHADDHRWMHPLMAPSLRASRLRDRRYTSRGLDEHHADEAVETLLAFLDMPRTSAEIEEHLAGLHGHADLLWWALRRFAPVVDAPSGEAWTFGQPRAFVRAAPPVAGAAGELVLRYLRAFGPATMGDLEQFSILRRPVVGPAVAQVREQLVSRGGSGARELLDLADASLPDQDTPAPPRLLPLWDNALLGYRDRSRVIPDGYRPLVIRRNGDVLPSVLVEGRVAGVWRVSDAGIEISPFHPLDEAIWEDLHHEARSLWELVATRDLTLHRRFDHWWHKDIPADHRRTIAP